MFHTASPGTGQHFKYLSQAQEMCHRVLCPFCDHGLGSADVQGLPTSSWSQGITTHEPVPVEPHLGTTSTLRPPWLSGRHQQVLLPLECLHSVLTCVPVLTPNCSIRCENSQGQPPTRPSFPVPCTWFMLRQ